MIINDWGQRSNSPMVQVEKTDDVRKWISGERGAGSGERRAASGERVAATGWNCVPQGSGLDDDGILFGIMNASASCFLFDIDVPVCLLCDVVLYCVLSLRST